MKVILVQPDGTQREMKQCSKCNQILEKDDFYKTASWCKKCQLEANRKRVRIR